MPGDLSKVAISPKRNRSLRIPAQPILEDSQGFFDAILATGSTKSIFLNMAFILSAPSSSVSLFICFRVYDRLMGGREGGEGGGWGDSSEMVDGKASRRDSIGFH